MRSDRVVRIGGGFNIKHVNRSRMLKTADESTAQAHIYRNGGSSGHLTVSGTERKSAVKRKHAHLSKSPPKGSKKAKTDKSPSLREKKPSRQVLSSAKADHRKIKNAL